jgi:hypothetical protein
MWVRIPELPQHHEVTRAPATAETEHCDSSHLEHTGSNVNIQHITAMSVKCTINRRLFQSVLFRLNLKAHCYKALNQTSNFTFRSMSRFDSEHYQQIVK